MRREIEEESYTFYCRELEKSLGYRSKVPWEALTPQMKMAWLATVQFILESAHEEIKELLLKEHL